jgi:uncharacterized protein
VEAFRENRGAGEKTFDFSDVLFHAPHTSGDQGVLMSQNAPLMPKATAVWLIENTSLTFDQIARFCKIHPLEVKSIADGEVAAGIKGQSPITRGILSREEIDKAQIDASYDLKMLDPKVRVPEFVKRGKAKYTPLSRRQDRPNAILWLLRNHPELKDAQVIRLVGTTKSTIAQIKERTHWNISQLTPLDPVGLSLCTQIDLDFEVARAAKNRPEQPTDTGASLAPIEETTRPSGSFPFADLSMKKVPEQQYDAASVFAKLKPQEEEAHADSAEASENDA